MRVEIDSTAGGGHVLSDRSRGAKRLTFPCHHGKAAQRSCLPFAAPRLVPVAIAQRGLRH